MKMARLLIAFFFLTGLFENAHADFNLAARGTNAAAFLEMGSGARNAALGEAAADSRDPNTIFTNPAGMTALITPAFTLGHSIGFESGFYDVGAAAMPVGKHSAVGIGVLYAGSGDVTETDASAVERGSFSPNDQSLNLGAARDFEMLSAGLSVKYVRSTVFKTAQTLAIDAGLSSKDLWRDRLKFELAALNVGGKLKYESASEELPMSVRAGAAFRPYRKLLLAADAVFPKSNAMYPAVGTEWTLAESKTTAVLLRAGVNGRRGKDLAGSGFSGGAGIRLGAWRLDYSFVPYGELGDTHQIAITFSKAPAVSVVEPEAIPEPPPPVQTNLPAKPPAAPMKKPASGSKIWRVIK